MWNSSTTFFYFKTLANVEEIRTKKKIKKMWKRFEGGVQDYGSFQEIGNLHQTLIRRNFSSRQKIC